ncbi:laminin subunit beta-3 [Gastrophryne carolinensis]
MCKAQGQRMRLCIILLGFMFVVNAQQDCSNGACYPTVGDLLLGRTNRLRASSTCGMEQPETYCTPYGKTQLKCCRCDSRVPFTEVSHRVVNMVSPVGPLRWWQSENDVDSVFLQVDLDRKFQLSDVTLDFRSPRPAGMIIERSSDFGKTWQVYQYLAYDCASAFPHVRHGRPQQLNDVVCQQLHGNPTHGGKMSFSPMAITFAVPISKSQQMQMLGEFTNLRIHFTQLTRLPPQVFREPSAFYAVNEMRVHGSCLCYGHADRCVAGNLAEKDPFGDIQVHDTCVCQHNTAGTNCERCADLYNDLPWRPADDKSPNACKRCNCNNHAEKCYFDPDVYEASGRVSGGVCVDCAYGTTGVNCERCKPDYYRKPNTDISHRDACVSCDCDPEGGFAGGSCDQTNGRCICKENVGGERCDQCKPGFYLLSASNDQGCTKCDCDPRGTERDQPCDTETGQCRCLPNVIGRRCDQCATHHWNLVSGRGCQRCGCHPTNSYNLQCNQVTGQCLCRDGFGGKFCTECPDRMYGNLQFGCRACNCDFQGTIDIGCDKATGMCLCRPGIMGARCDTCQRGYVDTYPDCKPCHSCFQFYDHELRIMRGQMQHLQNASAGQESQALLNFGPWLANCQSELQRIQSMSSGSGLFTVVNSAYHSSQESGKRALAAMATVSQSREARKEVNGFEGRIQDELEDLETLKDELSYPDHTPTINRVCEGIKTDTCTPENCPGTFCRRNNITMCKVGNLCRGAFPLSMNALRNTQKTSQDLSDLNNQLLNNAQMIQEAEKTSNQIKDSAQLLMSQVSQTRKDMEQRITSTRQFIQQVKDFLAEPSTDPDTIQEVSEYVLSLKLPFDALSLQRKMNELRSIAERLPNVELILSQTKDDIAKARKLQADAEEARTKANGVEDKVDGVVENLKTAKKALQEAEDKIQGSSISLGQIQDRMLEIKGVLEPVETGLQQMEADLHCCTERVEKLRDKRESLFQQAAQAKQTAEGAHGKALDAQQGMESLKMKYSLLKSRLGQPGINGAHAQKIASIKREADDLFKESQETMRRMIEIESEFQKDQQSIMMKVTELKGLEAEVIEIRNYINTRALYYATCRD